MLTILPYDLHLNFLKWRRLAFAISGMLIVISLTSLATRGLNLSLDFTGGIIAEVVFEEAPDINLVRQSMLSIGLDDAQVQSYGASTDMLIRLMPHADRTNANLSATIIEALNKVSTKPVEIRRIEFVGPQVGKELTEKGGLAMLASLILIFLYVRMRYELKFSAGAVLALLHDVIITIGIFSLFKIAFDLTVLSALLAVIGYSINDTIVIYDRIRGEFRSNRTGGAADIMNHAINETMSRTIVTGLTTLLVLCGMLIFGGTVLEGFALALIIGILIGTYSSVFIASAIALELGFDRNDLQIRTERDAELNDRP